MKIRKCCFYFWAINLKYNCSSVWDCHGQRKLQLCNAAVHFSMKDKTCKFKWERDILLFCQGFSEFLSDGKFIGLWWNLPDFPDWETIYWICTRLSSAVVDQEHKNMKLLEILFQIKFMIYLANCIHSCPLWRFLLYVFPKMRTLPRSLSGYVLSYHAFKVVLGMRATLVSGDLVCLPSEKI